MTKKEMTEVFSVMMLAWPSAEMFKGGIAKLGPTIELWTKCLSDVDFWTAQQAVVRLCRECKFPPAIAEFKGKVDNVNEEIETDISHAFQSIRSSRLLYESTQAYYEKLPDGNRTKMVIDAMGGPDHLTITRESKSGTISMWNLEGFESTYRRLLRKEQVLSGSLNHAQLTAGTRRNHEEKT